MNNNSVVNIDDRRRKTTSLTGARRLTGDKRATGIAEELRISESYVSRMRCEHAPDTRHHVWGGGVDWAGVDWRGKRNKEIALDTHKSESAVSKRRAEYAPVRCR